MRALKTALIGLALVAFATPAHAGTFNVYACADSPSLSNKAWVPWNDSPATLTQSTSCDAPVGLASSATLLQFTPSQRSAGFSFAATPGTTISAVWLTAWLGTDTDH